VNRQVAQLLQRDRATHELLRIAKLRSGIFEPPFWGLRGNVDASCARRWKKRGRLPIGDNWTFLLALTAEELRSDVFEPPFGGLRGKVRALSIPRWKASDRLPISNK